MLPTVLGVMPMKILIRCGPGDFVGMYPGRLGSANRISCLI